MKKTLTMFAISLLACAALTACAPQEESVQSKEQQTSKQTSDSLLTTQTKENAPVVTSECLSCHPYEDVIEASANYVDPDNGPTNPHRMIDKDAVTLPHESENGMPMDCEKCHTNHTVDTNGVAVGVELPTELVSCYAECHHNMSFDACSGCHNDKY